MEYAEHDSIGTGGLIPNDPNFSSQWYHQNNTKPTACIQTPLAWDITQWSTNVIVAVLDSGLTLSAEFTNRLVSGYNFVSNTTDTTDDHGHGAAVTGVLAANANNTNLIAGVDWHCRLMPIKVLDSNNQGSYSWMAQGIDFAVINGAKVINFSAGGTSTSITLTRAITNAIAQGAIFVTITHNQGTNIITFPGSLTNSITVGATDAQDRRASFSNYGPAIDLCAPGQNISTVSRSGTLLTGWQGTSLSALQVAGVCALLAAIRPGITHEQARLLLCAGADDGVGDATDTPGFDNYYGYGRLNSYNTLLLALIRIDSISLTNNSFQLSWFSPSNASNKKPYQIESTIGLTGGWTIANTTAFVYTTNRTYWVDTNTIDNVKFYRIRIQPLP